MIGWPGAEGNSGGQLDGGPLGILPAHRRQFGHVPVGGAGQALQRVFEIRVRFDAVESAVGDQRVQHRAALARFTSGCRSRRSVVRFKRGHECRGPGPAGRAAETAVTVRWIAERLRMGSVANVNTMLYQWRRGRRK